MIKNKVKKKHTKLIQHDQGKVKNTPPQNKGNGQASSKSREVGGDSVNITVQNQSISEFQSRTEVEKDVTEYVVLWNGEQYR